MIRRTLVMAFVCFAASLPAMGYVWEAQDSGFSGSVQVSGTSLDNMVIICRDSATIRKFDPVTKTWNELADWTAHYTDNTNWAGGLRCVQTVGDKIYVGGYNSAAHVMGLYDGVNWNDVSIPHPWSTPRSVDAIYVSADGNRAVIARNSAFYNIVENGVTTFTCDLSARPWGNSSKTMASYQGVVGVGNTVYFKNTENTVVRSDDFGASWSSPVTSTGGGGFGGLFALSESTVYSAGGAGTIGLSTDSGATWTSVAVTGAGTTRAIHAFDADRLLVAGDGLFYTEDAGSNWTCLNDQLPGFNDNPQKLTFIQAVGDHVFVSGLNGSLYMATVPEPATLGVLLVGGLLALRRRK